MDTYLYFIIPQMKVKFFVSFQQLFHSKPQQIFYRAWDFFDVLHFIVILCKTENRKTDTKIKGIQFWKKNDSRGQFTVIFFRGAAILWFSAPWEVNRIMLKRHSKNYPKGNN